jgi:hypothetical protein
MATNIQDIYYYKIIDGAIHLVCKDGYTYNYGGFDITAGNIKNMTGNKIITNQGTNISTTVEMIPDINYSSGSNLFIIYDGADPSTISIHQDFRTVIELDNNDNIISEIPVLNTITGTTEYITGISLMYKLTTEEPLLIVGETYTYGDTENLFDKCGIFYNVKHYYKNGVWNIQETKLYHYSYDGTDIGLSMLDTTITELQEGTLEDKLAKYNVHCTGRLYRTILDSYITEGNIELGISVRDYRSGDSYVNDTFYLEGGFNYTVSPTYDNIAGMDIDFSLKRNSRYAYFYLTTRFKNIEWMSWDRQQGSTNNISTFAQTVGFENNAEIFSWEVVGATLIGTNEYIIKENATLTITTNPDLPEYFKNGISIWVYNKTTDIGKFYSVSDFTIEIENGEYTIQAFSKHDRDGSFTNDKFTQKGYINRLDLPIAAINPETLDTTFNITILPKIDLDIRTLTQHIFIYWINKNIYNTLDPSFSTYMRVNGDWIVNVDGMSSYIIESNPETIYQKMIITAMQGREVSEFKSDIGYIGDVKVLFAATEHEAEDFHVEFIVNTGTEEIILYDTTITNQNNYMCMESLIDHDDKISNLTPVPLKHYNQLYGLSNPIYIYDFLLSNENKIGNGELASISYNTKKESVQLYCGNTDSFIRGKTSIRIPTKLANIYDNLVPWGDYEHTDLVIKTHTFLVFFMESLETEDIITYYTTNLIDEVSGYGIVTIKVSNNRFYTSYKGSDYELQNLTTNDGFYCICFGYEYESENVANYCLFYKNSVGNVFSKIVLQQGIQQSNQTDEKRIDILSSNCLIKEIRGYYYNPHHSGTTDIEILNNAMEIWTEYVLDRTVSHKAYDCLDGSTISYNDGEFYLDSIYNNYITYNENLSNSMHSRLYRITSLFQTKEYIINNKHNSHLSEAIEGDPELPFGTTVPINEPNIFLMIMNNSLWCYNNSRRLFITPTVDLGFIHEENHTENGNVYQNNQLIYNMNSSKQHDFRIFIENGNTNHLVIPLDYSGEIAKFPTSRIGVIFGGNDGLFSNTQPEDLYYSNTKLDTALYIIGGNIVKINKYSSFDVAELPDNLMLSHYNGICLNKLNYSMVICDIESINGTEINVNMLDSIREVSEISELVNTGQFKTNLINSESTLFGYGTSSSTIELYDNVKKWNKFSDSCVYDTSRGTAIYFFEGDKSHTTLSHTSFIESVTTESQNETIVINMVDRMTLLKDMEIKSDLFMSDCCLDDIIEGCLGEFYPRTVVPTQGIRYYTDPNDMPYFDSFYLGEFVTFGDLFTYLAGYGIRFYIDQLERIRVDILPASKTQTPKKLNYYIDLDGNGYIPIIPNYNPTNINDLEHIIEKSFNLKINDDAVYNTINIEYRKRFPMYLPSDYDVYDEFGEYEGMAVINNYGTPKLSINKTLMNGETELYKFNLIEDSLTYEQFNSLKANFGNFVVVIPENDPLNPFPHQFNAKIVDSYVDSANPGSVIFSVGCGYDYNYADYLNGYKQEIYTNYPFLSTDYNYDIYPNPKSLPILYQWATTDGSTTKETAHHLVLMNGETKTILAKLSEPESVEDYEYAGYIYNQDYYYNEWTPQPINTELNSLVPFNLVTTKFQEQDSMIKQIDFLNTDIKVVISKREASFLNENEDYDMKIEITYDNGSGGQLSDYKKYDIKVENVISPNIIQVSEEDYNKITLSDVIIISSTYNTVTSDFYYEYITFADRRYVVIGKSVDQSYHYISLSESYPEYRDTNGNFMNIELYDSSNAVMLNHFHIRGNPMLQLIEKYNSRDDDSIEMYGEKIYSTTINHGDFSYVEKLSAYILDKCSGVRYDALLDKIVPDFNSQLSTLTFKIHKDYFLSVGNIITVDMEMFDISNATGYFEIIAKTQTIGDVNEYTAILYHLDAIDTSLYTLTRNEVNKYKPISSTDPTEYLTADQLRVPELDSDVQEVTPNNAKIVSINPLTLTCDSFPSINTNLYYTLYQGAINVVVKILPESTDNTLYLLKMENKNVQLGECRLFLHVNANNNVKGIRFTDALFLQYELDDLYYSTVQLYKKLTANQFNSSEINGSGYEILLNNVATTNTKITFGNMDIGYDVDINTSDTYVVKLTSYNLSNEIFETYIVYNIDTVVIY